MNQFYPKKSQLTGIRWLARHILLASILVLAGINVAHAVPNTWYLEDVQFDSSATAIGSFVFDADTDTYSNISISISISISIGNENTANTYGDLNPSSPGNANFMLTISEFMSDLTGQPGFSLDFAESLTNAGGTVDISISPFSSQGVCLNPTCSSPSTTERVTSGKVTTVQPTNTAPILAVISNQTVNEGQLLEFTISASDPDTEDTLTFQLGNSPTGAILTNNGDGTATFSWTPAFTQAGSFPDVLFTVNDDGLPVKADMETITIAVGDINLPPQFDALASQNSGEGVELSFNVQATDPDGNTITLTVSNSPSGAVFTDNGNGNGTFTWVPDFVQAGNYTVMFTATNDGEPMQSDTLDVTITIGDVNQPPVLSMIGNRVVVENELLEIILTGSDPDGDNLSYSASNLPTGAAFNDNGDGTATFSWMPNFDQAGNYPNVLFTVTDNGVPAQSDSESITFTVGDGNRPPVFIPIGNGTATEGQLFEFFMIAFDPEGNPLSYTISNTPAGATFTDNGNNTATFSWVPDFGQAGSYLVTFTVNDAAGNHNGGNTTTQTITIFVNMTISDQIAALKIASWNQVPDRPVRITANARLAQAIQYNKIASIYFQKNRLSVAIRYLNLAMSSVNQYISTLELGITKNKFSEQEVSSLLTAANAIIADMQRSLP